MTEREERAAMTDADVLRRIACTLDNFLCSDANALREVATRLDEQHCDTCKWWKRDLTHRTRTCPVMLIGHTIDGDGYELTPAGFGCVLREEKE